MRKLLKHRNKLTKERVIFYYDIIYNNIYFQYNINNNHKQ